MDNEKNNANPFADMMQFYVKQAELMAPIIKQGLEDWMTVYTKVWTEGIRMQSEWMKQGFGKK